MGILLPIESNTNLWNHAFERLHDSAAFSFLVVGEASSNNYYSGQYNTEIQLHGTKYHKTSCLI